MRLTTFTGDQGSPEPGLIVDGRVLRLAPRGYPDMLFFLRGGERAIAEAVDLAASGEEGVPLAVYVVGGASGVWGVALRSRSTFRIASYRVSLYVSACSISSARPLSPSISSTISASNVLIVSSFSFKVILNNDNRSRSGVSPSRASVICRTIRVADPLWPARILFLFAKTSAILKLGNQYKDTNAL